MFKYKGFSGSADTSTEDLTLHGKIECIGDLVTYEAETMAGLQQAFIEAVDDYIETCELIGKSPEKPMSGSFNVRIGEQLHRKAFLKAKVLKISLNDFVKSAVEEKISDKKEVHFHIQKHEETSTFTSTTDRRFISSTQTSRAWAGAITRRDH